MPDPIIVGDDTEVRLQRLGTDSRTEREILGLEFDGDVLHVTLVFDRVDAQRMAVLLADAARER